MGSVLPGGSLKFRVERFFQVPQYPESPIPLSKEHTLNHIRDPSST